MTLSPLIYLCIGGLAILMLSAIVFGCLVRNAPSGKEDSSGFHLVEK